MMNSPGGSRYGAKGVRRNADVDDGLNDRGCSPQCHRLGETHEPKFPSTASESTALSKPES